MKFRKHFGFIYLFIFNFKTILVLIKIWILYYKLYIYIFEKSWNTCLKGKFGRRIGGKTTTCIWHKYKSESHQQLIFLCPSLSLSLLHFHVKKAMGERVHNWVRVERMSKPKERERRKWRLRHFLFFYFIFPFCEKINI